METDLYLLSLSIGPTSIANLADHLHISRPNVYKLISGLEEHRLAKFSERKKFARTFMVESPTIVTGLLRRRRETIDGLDRTVVHAMPDLLALYRQGELPTSIKIFQGSEQFRKAYFQTLEEEAKEICFYGSAHDFLQFLPWSDEQEWIKLRVQKKIFARSLFLPSDETTAFQKEDKRYIRETRVLKEIAPFITAFQLYANKVIIWQPKVPLAVLIEDEYIAAMLKAMFETHWKLAAMV